MPFMDECIHFVVMSVIEEVSPWY